MGKIGIFMGSFNPVHIGHLSMADEALLRYGLDKVVFVPCGDPYGRPPSDVPAKVRFEMLQTVCVLDPRYVFSSIDVDKPGRMYASDVILALRNEYPKDQLYLITGDDTLLDILMWKDSARILAQVHVLAFARDPEACASSRKIAERLCDRYSADIEVIDFSERSVSAARLRALALTGHSFRYFVPDSVYGYICRHGLYGVGTD